MSRLLLLGAGGGNASAAFTYATWNPADKSASVTLSGSNLIATGPTSGGANYGARSTIGKSSGKWYWEITVTTVTGEHISIGIAPSTESLQPASVNDLSRELVYHQNGNKYDGGAAFGATYAQGAVIGVALDMDAGTAQLFKNNVSQGTLTGLTGTQFAYYLTESLAGTGTVVTVNFGASALIYTPPVGFNAGLYT